jgi:hypothetical protein
MDLLWKVVLNLVKVSKLYITGDELDNIGFVGNFFVSVVYNNTWIEYCKIISIILVTIVQVW